MLSLTLNGDDDGEDEERGEDVAREVFIGERHWINFN